MCIHQRFQRTIYRATLIFFLFLFVALFSLLPIDTLIQSTKNEQLNAHLAVNTVIVIACCVIFMVVSLFLASYRLLGFYQLLSEIPKKYVPVHMNDFTGKEYYTHIAENTKECQMIYYESNTPKYPIEHDGLSSPIRDETVIPSSLVYEDVVRSIGGRVRLSSDERLSRLSLREVFSSRGHKNEEVVQIYEKLRFSNKAIRQDDFLEFLVELVKMYR